MQKTYYKKQIDKAEELYGQGCIQKALAICLNLNNTYPGTPEVLNNIGAAYYKLDQPEQALEYLHQATKLDPDFREAKENLQAVRATLKDNTNTSEDMTAENQPTLQYAAPSSKDKDIPQDYFPIRTKEDITVCTPPTVENMSSFVLLEQEDWFEPEIDFVRSFLKPGMTALDIGACFGVYTLPMAKAVGPEGKVFAFEPGTEAREYLEKSCQQNNFNNLDIISNGLTNQLGSTKLQIDSTPERNVITSSNYVKAEDIELTTLDDWWKQTGQLAIDFIKLDVNGHELQILQGGTEFLTQSSPVLLVNVIKEGEVNLDILSCLKEFGYRLYQYVPGPRGVTTFKADVNPDPYLLNIIAFKEDKVHELAKKGLLFTEKDTTPFPSEDSWECYIANLPWTEPFMATWQQHSKLDSNRTVMEGVNHLCVAQFYSTPAKDKYNHLLQAVKLFVQLFESSEASGSVALSLSRTFYELGLRHKAVQVLHQLLQAIEKGQCTSFNQPFLPPLPRFDKIPIQYSAQQWIIARCIESLIYLESFSQYFLKSQNYNLLKNLLKNQEHLLDTEKRVLLIKEKAAKNIDINFDNKNLLYNVYDNDNINICILKTLSKSYKQFNLKEYCQNEKIVKNSNDIPSAIKTVNIHFNKDRFLSIKIPQLELFRLRSIFQENEYRLPDNFNCDDPLIVIDVGANVGCFALYAQQWSKHIKIHCFEPNPQVLPLLNENLNNYDNVVIYPWALSDRDEYTKLYQHPVNTGASSVTKSYRGSKVINIRTRHAAKFFQEIGINNIDILKIDTEGSEVNIIKALNNYLPYTRLIMLEYHSAQDFKHIQEILKNFSLIELKEVNNNLGTAKYINKNFDTRKISNSNYAQLNDNTKIDTYNFSKNSSYKPTHKAKIINRHSADYDNRKLISLPGL